MPAPPELLQWIDSKTSAFIARLSEAVGIPSISGDPAFRPSVIEMSNWLNKQLQAVGVTTKQVDLGQHVMDGQTLPLPPAILGRIGEDPGKKTILIYGHFDVQPASKSDGWETEPFVLTEEKDGRLVGRGSSDDKGPVLGWLNVLQWHHETQKPLPVNLVFCFEGMEENGSEGLDELVEKEKDGWFKNVDCVCISDNYWLNTRTPALTYGLRGLVYFKITISGPGRDLHSGVFGRTVHEPMTDLISLMGRLVDPAGNILVPGVDDMVSAADVEEKAIYEKLDYSIADVESAAGGRIALSADKSGRARARRYREAEENAYGASGASAGEIALKTSLRSFLSCRAHARLGSLSVDLWSGACLALSPPSSFPTLPSVLSLTLTPPFLPQTQVLMGRMRLPSLSLHGIEGAFAGPGAKTVIPAKVHHEAPPSQRAVDGVRRHRLLLRWVGAVPVVLDEDEEPVGHVASSLWTAGTTSTSAHHLFLLSSSPRKPPDAVEPLVKQYLESEFAKLGSKNKMEIELLHSGKPWVADWKHWNYAAAIKATEAIYKQTPDLTREGGSIPVTLTFAETLNVNVLLLPMGRGDDGAHSTNEKLDKSNFIEGTKLLGTYLYEIGDVKEGGK
ncbi:CNDP dipeptidase [Mycena venus]|uniref:CNDP dipeptidase n=1 Tax=Mycena venus TaxID=2733690 RepID=A0A8H6X4Z6_9AGAR|nr:CNDP dipeptidase [Mycena venus]